MMARREEIKGIFFDLYGTLLIYHHSATAWTEWQRAFYDLLRTCGLSLPLDRAIHPPLHGFLRKA
jgi:FMN phosphatase YigB (HAD superfamily)